MSEKVLRPLFEQTLDELQHGLNQWLSQKSIIGHIFSAPVKTEGGWKTGPESPQEVVPHWRDTIELVFGRNLEQLKSKAILNETLAPYYSSATPPPRWSTGEDLTHELKTLLCDFLGQARLKEKAVEYLERDKIVAKACDYFLRKSDVYWAKSPILGVRTPQTITFSAGQLLPLTWSDRIEILKDHSGGFHGAREQMHYHRVLDAEVLLSIRFERKRSKEAMLMAPTELQNLSDNTIQLLRVFDYGPVRDLWTDMRVESISSRGCGVLSSGIDARYMSGDPYSIDDEQAFVAYINRFLKTDRMDNSELKFIFNRLNDAWLRGRSVDFRVFDYVSILEALLVAAKDGEFRFRVSAMAAAFSSKATDEKRALFKLIRKAYDVRSKVAHCAKAIPPEEQLTSDELKTLGRVTHPIIRYALENGPTKLKDEALARLFC